MRRLTLPLLALLLPPPPLAQAPAWADPSPHRVRHVAVSPEVRLETLDWGGTGEAMVFLAGLGNTAHVFDEFAPRFLGGHRVVGITRRGFGASSRPDSGYDAATRARDIRAVLDTLGIGRAILVGHSIAGDELSAFAVAYPERVRALVYLDAYDYGATHAAFMRTVRIPPQAQRPMAAADSASAASVAAYLRRAFGVAVPEAEVRATYRFGPDGRVRRGEEPPAARVLAGTARSEYARIEAPALAIYAVGHSPERVFTRFEEFDAENRELARSFVAAMSGWVAGVRERFRAEARRGSVLELPGAHHYVFVSHADEVERAVRDFLRRER